MAFTSPVALPELVFVGQEREALPVWLDYHRAYLLSTLDGLDEEQAGRRVVPSLTTLHGMVRHMAWVEHHWFARVVGGSDEFGPYKDPDDRDAEWRLDKTDGLDADVAVFLEACERSREIVAGLDLDETRVTRRGRTIDVRWVMIHMIEEYAQHNGHADIIRELIDGKTAG